VGLKAGLDGYGKSVPHRDSIPGPYSPLRFSVPIPDRHTFVKHIINQTTAGHKFCALSNMILPSIQCSQVSVR
jgi:hypothetical protein